MSEITGRGAVVTGGASGIGYATAAKLGAKGARVVLADIEKKPLEAAVEQLRGQGIEAHGVECDVSSLASVEELAARSPR